MSPTEQKQIEPLSTLLSEEEIEPYNQATEYMISMNRAFPGISEETSAKDVAFVFLSPSQIFRVFLKALKYKYL